MSSNRQFLEYLAKSQASSGFDTNSYLDEASLSGLDADNDRLSDSEESAYFTNPLLPDSDADGVSDIFEIASAFDPLDPRDVPYEGLVRFEGSSADLRSIHSKFLDTDGDGLSNSYELDSSLNATAVDSDGDGFSDGIELLNGTDPLVSGYAELNDSDGDGLYDGIEATLGSSSSLKDSDGDSLSDPMEYLLGLNQRDPDTNKDGILDGYIKTKTTAFQF